MEKRGSYEKITALITCLVMTLFYTISYHYPLNGKQTTYSIAEEYPNLFTPPAYTNLICIILMLLMVGYSLFQFGLILKNSGKLSDERNQQMRLCFSISNLLVIIWILAWSFDFMALALVIVTILVIALSIINKTLSQENLSKSEKVFVRLPFSIGYGYMLMWLIINTITLLKSIRWNFLGISEEIWMIGVLAFVLCIVSYRTQKNKDIAYCLTVLWVYIGILMKHILKSELDGQYAEVIIALIIYILILLGNAGYLMISNRKREL